MEPRRDSGTAFGGSARSTADARTWRPRPVLALAIRITAFVVPVVAAFCAVRLGVHLVSRPRGTSRTVGWLIGLGAVSVAAVAVVDRLARRLVPVAFLYKLSLVFPDHAPPRFRTALRTSSGRALQRAVDAEAAEVELGTTRSTPSTSWPSCPPSPATTA